MDKVSQVLQNLREQQEQTQQQVEQITQTALKSYEQSLTASLQTAVNTSNTAIVESNQKLTAAITDHQATLSSNLAAHQQQANRILKMAALGGASLLGLGIVGVVTMLTWGTLQLQWQRAEVDKLHQESNSIRLSIKHLQQEQTKLEQKRKRK